MYGSLVPVSSSPQQGHRCCLPQGEQRGRSSCSDAPLLLSAVAPAARFLPRGLQCRPVTGHGCSSPTLWGRTLSTNRIDVCGWAAGGAAALEAQSGIHGRWASLPSVSPQMGHSWTVRRILKLLCCCCSRYRCRDCRRAVQWGCSVGRLASRLVVPTGPCGARESTPP